jgi:hypothetical protein
MNLTLEVSLLKYINKKLLLKESFVFREQFTFSHHPAFLASMRAS